MSWILVVNVPAKFVRWIAVKPLILLRYSQCHSWMSRSFFFSATFCPGWAWPLNTRCDRRTQFSFRPLYCSGVESTPVLSPWSDAANNLTFHACCMHRRSIYPCAPCFNPDRRRCWWGTAITGPTDLGGWHHLVMAVNWCKHEMGGVAVLGSSASLDWVAGLLHWGAALCRRRQTCLHLWARQSIVLSTRSIYRHRGLINLWLIRGSWNLRLGAIVYRCLVAHFNVCFFALSSR